MHATERGFVTLYANDPAGAYCATLSVATANGRRTAAPVDWRPPTEPSWLERNENVMSTRARSSNDGASAQSPIATATVAEVNMMAVIARCRP